MNATRFKRKSVLNNFKMNLAGRFLLTVLFPNKYHLFPKEQLPVTAFLRRPLLAGCINLLLFHQEKHGFLFHKQPKQC